MSVMVAVLFAVAGCKSSERCSGAIGCAKGSYQACSDGSSCRYQTSDGQSFACASCADCTGAVGAALAWCGAPSVFGSDGGAVAETPACMDYLTCVAATAPAQLATLTAAYGPGGSCWLSSATAASCDDACKAALASCGGSSGGDGSAGGGSGGGGSGGGGSGGGGSGGGGGGISPPDMSMPVYQKTTVAMMRASSAGAYELDGPIAIAITSSTTSPRLLFQDATGGPFSAMLGKASTTSPTVATTIATIATGSILGIKGQYTKSAGFEQFYIDAIVVTGAAALPAPASLQLADVQRNANSTAWWFQRVTVSLGATPLEMYDFSPAELQYVSTVATCPAYFGWGMVPATSSDTVGAACSGQLQPPSATGGGAAPSDELLIGTDFYKTFKYSADCLCAAQQQNTLLAGTNTLAGTLAGVLIGTTPYMQTTIYQYVAPTSPSDAVFQ